MGTATAPPARAPTTSYPQKPSIGFAPRAAPGEIHMRKALAAATMAACWVAGSAVAETPLERGQYLVGSIMGCGNCHTPVGPNGPIMDKALSGGPPLEENLFTAVPSNITPDPQTGIGKWTNAQIKVAIRRGKRPDGTLLGPPMPFGQYRP